MSINKELKESIGVMYLSAFDIDPRSQPSIIRKLLTLLLAAAKYNNDTSNIKIIMDCINECERAREELGENEPDWTWVCRKCDKILDKVTPMVFDGYGSILNPKGFSQMTVGAKQ